MPDGLTIRPEGPGDASEVAALVTAAFGQADEARLVARLHKDGDAAIALVAEAGGAIVGHVLLSPLDAPFRALALAPVSVAPPAQRGGIGSRLIEAALAQAAADDWQAIFVLGDPAYYGRFGFETGLAAGFTSPYSGPHLMARAVGAPELPTTVGTIGYASAFTAA